MSRTTEALEAFIGRSNVKHREVYKATVVCADGADRLIVRPEGCDADISVLSAASIGPGESVTALGPRGADGGSNSNIDSVLPSAVRPGPSTSSTVASVGTPFAPPEPPLFELIGILVDSSPSPAIFYAVLYDEAGAPLEILSSMPARSDTVGGPFKGVCVSGDGTVLINASRDRSFSRDYIQALDPRAGLAGEYLWPIPAPNPFLHNFKFSLQTTIGTRAYWVELNFDNGAQLYTWDLVSAEASDIGSTTSEGSFTLPYSNLAPSVEDPFMQAPRGPFFDGGVWNFDVTVRYHDGVQTVSPGKSLSVTWAPDVESLFTGATVFVSPRGLVDGNLGYHEPAGNDPIAARYLAARNIDLVWPASGLTARPASEGIGHPALIGINYSIPITPFSADGTFEFREGDITDSNPIINSVDCQDASGLTGGSLVPLASLRG